MTFRRFYGQYKQPRYKQQKQVGGKIFIKRLFHTGDKRLLRSDENAIYDQTEKVIAVG